MRYFLITAITIVLFTSCKKAEPSVTREDELRSGKWKMISGTIKVDPAIGLDTLLDYYTPLASCKKDDYLQLSTNFVGAQYSAEKCDPSEPDAVDFRWELYNNGTGINFWNANQTFFGRPTVSAIFLNYTTSRFTIRYVDYPISMVNSTKRDTITYTHTFIKF